MKPLSLAIIWVGMTILLHACVKPCPPEPPPTKGKILVDASKDGGAWWSPQYGASNNPDADHQGKHLADYLRSLNYQVHEVSQGTTITWSLLKEYDKVIRAGGFNNYLPEEIQAYDSFLSRTSSLMLLQDHLTHYSNDLLSEHLGVTFAGTETGSVTKFEPHPITTGVNSFNFVAGSTVTNSVKNPNMTIIGWLGNADRPVMGILHHPNAKIFFLGDINGLEQVQQPFTDNLISWLY